MDCIWIREVLCEGDWEGKYGGLLKCQLITLDVGRDLRLDHLVYVMLDVECAIQHAKSISTMNAYSSPNHYTPAVPLVLFSNTGVGITLASVVPQPDPSIAMGDTKPGLIGQNNLAAMPFIQEGPQCGRPACSVNRLRRLRIVCVDIQALWCPGTSATVLVDGLHRSHRCLRRICQACDSVVPGGRPLRGWF